MSDLRRWEAIVRHVQPAVVLLPFSALAPARICIVNLEEAPQLEPSLSWIDGYLATGLLWGSVLGNRAAERSPSKSIGRYRRERPQLPSATVFDFGRSVEGGARARVALVG